MSQTVGRDPTPRLGVPAVTGAGTRAARLAADLDTVRLRDSPCGSALLRAADRIVSGDIPAVAYTATRAGDPLRYLYDEGVALRRVAGVLGYAYASTKDRAYLRTLATSVARNASRWPEWNPGHPLDTAQIATAVALAYAWSGAELTAGERDEVVRALVERLLLPYSDDGQLARLRSAIGNQVTVVASAAALAALAVRREAPVESVRTVAHAAATLARCGAPDDDGRSVAGGPTVEGLMYTAYEAAHLALLHATVWCNGEDPGIRGVLGGSLADLGVLAAWSERCGTVVEPAVGDAWGVYPWVDRTTALAAMTAWPSAGGHVLGLLDALQERATLTVPGWGSVQVPDGIAELVVSGLRADAAMPPRVQSFVPRDGAESSYWGCASHGALRAFLTATPNDAPHAHRDVGNVVVLHGDQPVLADLGQRDYGFRAPHVWRRSTPVHNTIGLRRADGRVSQADAGRGSVATSGDGLSMASTSAVRGVDWRREVTVTGSEVVITDRLSRRRPGDIRRLSMSFLLPTPCDSVVSGEDGLLRFALPDGSVWELKGPAGCQAVITDARPTPPYADTPEFEETLAATHALVRVELELADRLDLTTVLRLVSTSPVPS